MRPPASGQRDDRLERLATARRFHTAFERRLARAHGADRVATVRAVLASHLDQAGAETALARVLRPL
jgi:hypothetical protein